MNSRGSDSGEFDLDQQLRLDADVLEFERELRSDRHPRIEDFVAKHAGPLRAWLLEELLALELEHATPEDSGQAKSEFLRRFPDDRQTVERCITGYLARDATADSDAAGSADRAELRQTWQHQPEGPGTTVGPYKLLEKIGEGGFGSVYIAEQKKPVRRRVAVKIIKLGMDTREVVARFEAERQALALMEHPNIAKVFDAGATATGRPYFAMELVRGQPITEYCDEKRLPMEKRLSLSADVCRAIQHAHQKGIIHRDVKPSNVLVALKDHQPMVKIIDFGVAKATQHALTEATVYTRMDQLVGTPLYMSPEQARSAIDVDTRTDVYSLGVLLYELITGCRPFDLERSTQDSFDDMRRRICEEDAARPSAKISSLTQQEISALARQRTTLPQKLRGQLSGDLDWIVMKALEKDPARRYQTANGLALDIERFLNNEPVTAVAPSLLYTFSKFAQRNRAALAVASTLAIVLIAATAVSSLMAWRAVEASRSADAATAETKKALRREERSASEAREARDDARRILARSDYRVGQSLADRGEYGRAVGYLARSLKSDPENSAAIDRIFNLLGYVAPPGYFSAAIDTGPGIIYASDSNRAGDLVAATSQELNGTATVRVWQANTAEPVLQWSQDRDYVMDLRFSPDGRKLAAAVTDVQWNAATPSNWVHGPMWNVEDWTLSKLIQPGTIRARFSADSQRMLLGSHVTDNVLIWDPNSGDQQQFDCVSWSPVLSPDEKQLATFFRNEVRIWDVASREVAKTFLDFRRIQQVTFSPDGGTLLISVATSSTAPTLILWHIDSEEIRAELPHDLASLSAEVPRQYLEQPNYARGIFSPDGRRVLSVATDKKVRLWDARTGELIDQRDVPTHCCALPPLISEDGLRVMLRSRYGECYFGKFDPQRLPDFESPESLARGFSYLATPGNIRPLLIPLADVSAAAVAPSGVMVLGSKTGEVVEFDVVQGRTRGRLPGRGVPVSAVAQSAESKQFALADARGQLTIWRAAAKLPLATWQIGDAGPHSVAFVGKGDTLVTWSRDDCAVWETESGELLTKFGSSTSEWGQLSRDGETVFLHDGLQVSAFNLVDGVRRWRRPIGGRATAAALSSGGGLLAVALDNRSVRVLATQQGQVVHEFATPATVSALTFASGAGALAFGTTGGDVGLFDVEAGVPIGRVGLRVPGACRDLAFDAAGDRLAASYGDRYGHAQVWDVDSGDRITEQLTVEAPVFDLEFLEHQLVLYPASGDDRVSRIATVFDVSIAETDKSSAWLPEAAAAMGGFQLDENSNLIPVEDRRTSQLFPETATDRETRFFSWLNQFPGTRSDSPFRSKCSEAYLNSLLQQDDFLLVNEFLRLQHDHPVGLAKRAALRPEIEGSIAAQNLALTDLYRAQLLAPNSAQVHWLCGLAYDRMKKAELAGQAYSTALALDLPSPTSLASIMGLQERFDTDRRSREQLAAQAIQGVNLSPEVVAHWIRLIGEAETELTDGETFKQVHSRWLQLADLPASRVDTFDLYRSYLQVARKEMLRLVAIGKADEARELARTVVLAELYLSCASDRSVGALSEAVGECVGWVDPESPTVNYIPRGAVWKYWDRGESPGRNWYQPEFDDSEWPSGRGGFGFGGNGERTTIRRSLDGATSITTFYFRHEFDVRQLELRELVYLDLLRDDGAVVYLNGAEVRRDNMSAGTITHDTLAVTRVSGLEETTYYRSGASLFPLKAGRNVLAIEVHQSDVESGDSGLDSHLFGLGISSADLLSSGIDVSSADPVAAAMPMALRNDFRRRLSFALEESPSSVVAQSAAAWSFRYRLQLLLGKLSAANETLHTYLRDSAASQDWSGVAAGKDWLRQQEAFVSRVPGFEIQTPLDSVRETLLSPPARFARFGPKQVDLSEYYNASLYDSRGWHGNPGYDLRSVPVTWRSAATDLEFDIRGLVQLTDGRWKAYPQRVNGIAIGATANRIHFLHSTIVGRATEGTEVARYVIHFDNGDRITVPVIFGDDVADWHLAQVPSSFGFHQKIVWRGRLPSGREIAVPIKTWDNPHPNRTIRSIDFVSTLRDARPFLLGITLE